MKGRLAPASSLAELDYIVTSKAKAVTLAENYVG
jgi:hypothetical protein